MAGACAACAMAVTIDLIRFGISSRVMAATEVKTAHNRATRADVAALAQERVMLALEKMALAHERVHVLSDGTQVVVKLETPEARAFEAYAKAAASLVQALKGLKDLDSDAGRDGAVDGFLARIVPVLPARPDTPDATPGD